MSIDNVVQNKLEAIFVSVLKSLEPSGYASGATCRVRESDCGEERALFSADIQVSPLDVTPCKRRM